MTGTWFELGCDGPSTLIVGVDGSDTSWRALYYAFGLARRQHSTVIAVFALTTPPGYDASTVTGYQANVALAKELKPEIRDLATQYGVQTEFVCIAGDPVTTLIKTADDYRADALILGASQSVLHRSLGSKSRRAVRRCHCPVTVVP